MRASGQPVLTVELVKLYRFSIDGLVLSFSASLPWYQIQQCVEGDLQRQLGMSQAAARQTWERMRSQT